jgi:uncharacterized protein (TIGR03437 family)
MVPWRQRYSAAGPDTLGQRARARRPVRPSLFGLEARLVLSGPAPTITAAVPPRGYLGGGTPITITGSDFGLLAIEDAVTVGGVAARILSASPTEIVILTPAGTGEQAIVVSVAGQAVTAPQAFTYADYTSPGSYSLDGLGTGILANPGFYVPDKGAISEKPADPGSYVPDKGATFEMQAPAGSYVPNPGARRAILAQPGYYVGYAGATVELPAMPGCFAPGIGSLTASCDPIGTWSDWASARYYYLPIGVIVS